MNPFRFGVVPYINLAPFRLALEELLPCEFIERTPSRLAELWKEEELEACILSTADIFDLRLGPLDGASISAGGPVASVLLLHDAPPFVWSRVALDPASRTSNLLARLLVPLHWKNEPAFVHHRDPVAALQSGLADAAVVIGDRALKLRSSRPALDLGALWKETTGLPFVFAAWVEGRGSRIPRADLERILEEAGRSSSSHIARAAREASRRSGIPAEEIERYFDRNISFRFGPDEKRGFSLFGEWARGLTTGRRGGVEAAPAPSRGGP